MKERLKVLITEHAEKRVEGIPEMLEDVNLPGLRVESEVKRLYLGEKLPSISEYDAVIVGGGPMGVYEMHLPQYDFLKTEADFIKDMVDQGKAVLGICLGHQLLTHVLGGRVGLLQKGLEAGWTKIVVNNSGRQDDLFEDMPGEFCSFQYHKDEVTVLSKDCINLASSELCEVQAFRYSTKPVWGVQFHPEISPVKATEILEARREVLEKAGIDVFLAVRKGFLVSQEPNFMVFYNFLKAVK